jgi:hypothetical protein
VSETEKLKPTHVLHVVFDNGVSVPVSWREQDQTWIDNVTGEPVESRPIEGFRERGDYLEVFKADGTIARFAKAKIIYYSVSPWKDLPDAMKERLEKAKASQSPHGPN